MHCSTLYFPNKTDKSTIIIIIMCLSDGITGLLQLTQPPIERKGKIRHVRFSTIHGILKKPLQYRLSQILQTRLPAILDIGVCRLVNLPYKL